MILTRQGFNSKMVVTGDVTQIDLPVGKRSGLLEAVEVLRGVEGIRFVYFDDRDVVRHALVQRSSRLTNDTRTNDRAGASSPSGWAIRRRERPRETSRNGAPEPAVRTTPTDTITLIRLQSYPDC